MPLEDQEFLFKLLGTPSPTGFEMPGQRVWSEFLKPVASEVKCDAYGSTWATKSASNSVSKSVMLEAHADEIGYMVRHITDEGFLYVDKLGGSDTATARGRRISILGDKGEVLGIIGNTAVHLRKDASEEKAPKVHELWIDVGVSNSIEVAKLGIRVGNVAVYADKPTLLGGDKIVSRALDNRIGGYIIAQAMKRLSEKTLTHNLICLNATQEEIGGFGAAMAAYRHLPDVCICIDVTHATDTPGLDAKEVGDVKLGKGPTVAHGSANHPLVVERLIQLASEKKIPLQHEATPNSTYTDTDNVYTTKQGIPSALVSLPIRSMHSVVETAHIEDINYTVDLLVAFVESLQAEDHFNHLL